MFNLSNLRRSRTAIAAFLHDEDAAISVEAAIILPVLGIFYVAAFSYFDAYRREAVMTKATYMVSDMLSREEGTITPIDLEGLQDVFEFVTFSEGNTWMRFTEVRRESDEIRVMWSYATDGNPLQTNATINAHLRNIPVLQDNERTVVVESFTNYEPPFNVNLSDRTFERFVTTRQRYAARLDFDGTILPTSVATVSADTSGCLNNGFANGLYNGNSNGVGTGNGNGCGHGLTGLQGVGATTPGNSANSNGNSAPSTTTTTTTTSSNGNSGSSSTTSTSTSTTSTTVTSVTTSTGNSGGNGNSGNNGNGNTP
ncbi:TadE/TadG family type IV pilus assembly protein [Jannaschia sp. M317]|uniref:TadE/TadG family type IV pilus assembly protein n=1 Tax=Jannaschia sp. M317 TaxID=2867011 RepID=UPI0021A824AF|nr:hypothetical protein [Jannaschia sp. M317]UWQ17498.1 hypothetical protein K3551_16725 [Jannaschia sp. M317]